MKLTTKRLKKIIREELDLLEAGYSDRDHWLAKRGILVRRVTSLQRKADRIRQDAYDHSGGNWYYKDKFFYDYGGMEVEEELAQAKAALEQFEATENRLSGEDPVDPESKPPTDNF